MAGIIVGYYGFQRSGKTLLAYITAENYRKKGCKVYSNMNVPNWIKISSLSEIPFDYEPKVLVLDEAYYFLDSRNWSNNTDSSIFFNTIGKQNILLLFTAISPDMIEKRIREQQNYIFISKGFSKYIHYKVLDVQRNKSNEFFLEKSDKFFQSLTYDTTQVPDYVDCNLKNFVNNVSNFNNNSINKKNDNERVVAL